MPSASDRDKEIGDELANVLENTDSIWADLRNQPTC